MEDTIAEDQTQQDGPVHVEDTSVEATGVLELLAAGISHSDGAPEPAGGRTNERLASLQWWLRTGL